MGVKTLSIAELNDRCTRLYNRLMEERQARQEAMAALKRKSGH